ncbi:MAG: PQQ-binding-like beta-propeller repeat protein [Spirochaetota bacterium]
MKHIIILISFAAMLTAADWPQFLGPDRNAVSSETKLIRSFPEGGPAIDWKTSTGDGFGGAAIAAGKLYFLDRAGDNDAVRCLDAASGKELWRYAYPAPAKISYPGSRATPTVNGVLVYVVGPKGHFTCLDKETGKVVWQKNIMDDYGSKLPTWGYSQNPLVYKKTVIVSVFADSAGLVAYDLASGDVVWKSRTLSGGACYVSPVLAEVDGIEQVLIISAKTKSGSGEIAGFDPNTGADLWSYDGWQCTIPISFPLAVGDGKFFITAGYGAGSVMIQVKKSGSSFSVSKVFATQDCGAQIHLPLFINGYLYAHSNDNSRRDGLVCLSLDGEKKWGTGKEPNFEKGGMLSADGVIYSVDGDSGILYIIDPSPDGYKPLAQAKVLTTKTAWAPLAIANGKLYLRDQKTIYCVSIAQ